MNTSDIIKIHAEIENLKEKIDSLDEFVKTLLPKEGGEWESKGKGKGKIRKQRKEPLKKKLTPKNACSKEITKIIDYWNSSGLRQHVNQNTNIYRNIVNRISALKAGKLFNTEEFKKYKGVSFSNEDIVSSIQNFAMAAINPDYQPSGDYKKYLAKTSLLDFMYNPNSDKNKSLFINFYEKPPKLSTDVYKSNIEDKNPRVTKAIQMIFIEKFLGGLTPKFSMKQQNDFKKAGNLLTDFYRENRKRLNAFAFRNGSQEVALASLLINAIIADVGENNMSKVSTGYACSEITFSQRLPAYLQNQGLIIK